MKLKTLLLLLATVIFGNFVKAQFLEPRFRDEVINFDNFANNKYLHHSPNTSFVGLADLTTDHFEEFYAEPTDEANWYRIKHMMTGQYLTVAGTDGELVQVNNYGNANPDAQKFQFVQQTVSGRYKIHSKFSAGGVDLILTVDYPGQTSDHLLYLSRNKTTGNDDNQEFDLNLVYPDEDPGTAIPSLANTYEGKKVGITVQFNGWELANNATINHDVIEHAATAGIGPDEDWVIEYTDETGWYKIKNKQQGKYITITNALDGALVSLETDAAYSDAYQKFKFIVQADGNDTYKIHSKFSVGPVGARRALVLDVPTTATIAIRLKKNLSTYGYNQKFVLTKDLPPPAAFTSGSTIDPGNSKILGKQYYISGFESLALLEPYVVGVDTFVRLQPHPVYGQQSEWTFDDGDSMPPYNKAVRIRYGKTGQYLYLPVSNENTAPTPGIKLKLRADNGGVPDRRYQFYISSTDIIKNRFFFTTTTGAATVNINVPFPYAHGQLKLDEDNMLSTEALNQQGDTYYQEKEFLINLSVPLDSSFTYSLITRAHSAILSDSGIRRNDAGLVTTSYADPTVNWHFIPTGDGYFYIKNHLTNYYLYVTGDGHLHTTAAYITGNPYYKFQLLVNMNYYHIRNQATGKYVYATNDAVEGAAVNISLNVIDWVITRSDYFAEPVLEGVAADGLLQHYAPNAQNALNDLFYRDRMMKNIGLPFDPPYQSTQPVATFVFNTEGISMSPVPDFYSVVRAALAWKFSYNATQLNQVIANYKLDSAGHRTQVVYALISYIMEHLANMNRNTQWTYNERELVTWIERKIKARRVAYGNELSESWTNFQVAYGLGDEVGFSLLLDGGGPDPANYQQPQYFLADSTQTVSLIEFATASRFFNYKRAAALSTLQISSLSSMGGLLLSTVISGQFVQSATNAVQAATDYFANLAEFSENLCLQEAQEASVLARNAIGILQETTCLSGATFAVSVVAIATQVLAMKVTDGLKFQHYNDAIAAKSNKLINEPVNVNTIMQADNLMDQFYLAMDFEIQLAAAPRVNYQAISTADPQPVYVDCRNAVPVADPAVVTNKSGGCGSLSVSLSSEINNGGAGSQANPYIVTRIYSVSDACGNVVYVTHVLTAIDSIKPTASNPAPLTVSCISNIGAPNILVVYDENDNCGVPAVSFLTATDNGGTGLAGNPYILTRIYRVTDAAGNFTDVTQTITAVNNVPATINVEQPGCGNNLGRITVTAPVGPNYQYSLNNISGPYQPGPAFYVAPGNSYTVYAKNAAGCISAATAAINPQPTVPAAPIVSGTVNVCAYAGTATNITYTATASGGGNQAFNWVLPPNVNLVSGAGTNSIIVNFPNAAFVQQANKQIKVTATNSCGTSQQTIYYLLAQLPGTPASITTAGPDICTAIGNALSVTYSIPKVPAATAYSWAAQNGTTSIVHPNGTGVNDTIVTISFATGFSSSPVTVSAVNGCGISAARSLMINRTVPAIPGPITGPTNVCAYVNGNTIEFSEPAVPGITYNWTVPNGAGIASGQSTNIIAASFNQGFSNGSVTVTATNGCGTSAARSLAVTTLSPATPGVIDVIQLQSCPNRVYSYTLATVPANATSLSWTWPPGAMLQSQTVKSIVLSYPGNAIQGAVTVQATNNCASSVVRTVSVKLAACAVEAAKGTGNNEKAAQPGKLEQYEKENTDAFALHISPNPSTTDFGMQVATQGKAMIKLNIMDAQGRLLQSLQVGPYQPIRIGAELKSGMYIVEAVQGDKKITERIIKF